MENGAPEFLRPAASTFQGIDRQELPVKPKFFDKLTLKPLPDDLRISWVQADGKTSMPVTDGIPSDRLRDAGASWKVQREGKVIGRFGLEDCFSEAQGGYLIPYFCIVEVNFRGMRDGDFEHLACQVSHLEPELLGVARGDQDYNLLDSVFEQGTPAYTLRRYQRMDGPVDWEAVDRVIEGEKSFFQWDGPGGGPIAVRIESESYGEMVEIAEPVAGEITKVQITLHRGPRLRGTLRDQEGVPLPFQTLRALVEIGQDGDWGDAPGHFAVAVGGSPGNWHRCAQGTVKTDAEGEFSIEMPPGTRFAMEYPGEASYGFAETDSFPVTPTGDIVLDVTAIDFSSGYAVKVLDDHGRPMSNVYVRPLVASDYPWFRQFTAVPANEHGEAILPGIQQGSERVRIIVQTTKQWSEGKMLARFPFDHPLPPPPLKLVVEQPQD